MAGSSSLPLGLRVVAPAKNLLADALPGRMRPPQTFSVERCYVGTTNVLETTFRTDRGRLPVADLMPVYARTSERRGCGVGASNHLLWQLECLDGSIDVEVQFKPSFDSARAQSVLDDMGPARSPAPKMQQRF